jgi:hypothetical protein
MAAKDRLAEVASELYAAPPDEFVARRDEHVRALRAAGERALAAEVGKLRKPVVAAWALNLLAQQRPEVLAQLVSLGPALVEAQRQLDGDALRQLATQRQRVVHALVQEARGLAADVGHPIGQDVAYEVETTLNAAVSDAEIAERVLSGQLLKPESYAGFGPAPDRPALRVVEEPPARTATSGRATKDRTATKDRPATKEPATKEPSSKEPTKKDRAAADRRAAEERAAERRRAEQRAAEEALTAAQATLDEAQERLAEARASVEEAEATHRELGERAAELRAELAEIGRRLTETDLDQRRAERVSGRAEGEVERARKRVEAAQRRVRDAGS